MNGAAYVSMSYMVMGDAANLASRLEVARKAYGMHLLVNARTVEMVDEMIECGEVDQLRIEDRDSLWKRVHSCLATKASAAASADGKSMSGRIL